MSRPLRLMIYDDTCRRSRLGVGLTHSWIAGALLYRQIGKFDATRGVRSWEEALQWLSDVEKDRSIGEIQFWGHGKWGRALIDGAPLTTAALAESHPWNRPLRDVAERMVPDALWWFRTCETFGAEAGHDFARRWTDFFECRAAGHTYIIGPWQSGLHALNPGEVPRWSVYEGLDEGAPDAPRKALWSIPGAPNTISFLRATLPRWAYQSSAFESGTPRSID